MTLDEAKEVLKTFTLGDIRVLDITPGTAPASFNALVSVTYPDADPGKLTGRELEAIRVYVGQWGDEEVDALITRAYLQMAREAGHVE